MKIVYFGTPEFAATVLESLHKAPNCEITKVITQPDRKIGRKMILTPTPVKKLAKEINLPVEQPKNRTELANIMKKTEADFFIVVAYGMILDEEILNTPKVAAINVHTSLLPKYRGASPIQEALLNGETETGVTIMQMNEKLDAGGIYILKRLSIEPDDNFETLSAKLVNLAANVLPIVLQDINDGVFTPIPQNEKKATYCKKINKADGKIDWTKSAEEINNMIRAYTPWPSAYTHYKGITMKILKAEINEEKNKAGEFRVEEKTLKIGTGKGTLIPILIQPQGKNPIDAAAFINGYLNR